MTRILCVDDDAMILKGLTAMIQRFDLPPNEIITANNAPDALEILGHSGADIVISDIDMPHMSGLALIRAAKEHGYCDRFIILTGYDKFEYAREALRSGVCDYMLKPINKQELCDNLHRLFRELQEAPSGNIDGLLASLGLTRFDADRQQLPETFQKILSFIDSKYQIDVSLEILSKTYSLHPNYICALFREHLDTTFLHYLDLVRLKKSVEILVCSPKMVIRDVAIHSGFLSESHFYKVFKKRLGRTPASIREQAVPVAQA